MSPRAKDLLSEFVTLGNLIPLGVMLVSLCAAWFSLSNKIELLTQKVEYLTQIVQSTENKYTQVETRLGAVELSEEKLQTTLAIHLKYDGVK